MSASIPLQQTLQLLDTQDRLRALDRAQPSPSDLAAHLLTISKGQGSPMTQADADRVVKASMAKVYDGSTISMKDRPATREAWKENQAAARKKLAESKSKRTPLRKKSQVFSTATFQTGLIGMLVFAAIDGILTIYHAARMWSIFSGLMAFVFLLWMFFGEEILSHLTGLDQRLDEAEDQVRKDEIFLKQWSEVGEQITLDQLSDWVKIPGMTAVLYAIFQSDVPFLGQDRDFLQARWHEYQITHGDELAAERNRLAQQKATDRHSKHLAFLQQQMAREAIHAKDEPHATLPAPAAL